jgi:chitinase
MTTIGSEAGSAAPDRPAIPAPEPLARGRPSPRASGPMRLGALLAVAAFLTVALTQSVAGPVPAPAIAGSRAGSSPSPVPLASSPTTVAAAGGPVLGRGGVALPLRREVFGFLPYWTMGDGMADALRYDHLSTIALFGIGIRKDGTLNTKSAGYRAYTGPTASTITDRAHAKGVRVVPTFQLFDKGKLPTMTAFLGDPAAQKRFIKAAIALMKTRHADGAVLDFEPFPDRLTAPFTAFASDFRHAIRAVDPAAHLTVALHQAASDSQIAAVAGVVDRIFAMAYDYHWIGSPVAGAVAPLDGPGGDVRTTLTRFVEGAGRAKVILGVPYFGYDWPVAFKGPGAIVSTPVKDAGGAWSIGYAAAVDFLEKHEKLKAEWDPVASSPYFTYRDSKKDTYRQVWYEDRRSLAAKYALARDADVVGVGIWALGMDRGTDELWSLLRTMFVKKG